VRSSAVEHWPEYSCEALELCLFMISAGGFTILLEYPSSPAHHAIGDPFLRRMLIGITMGCTAIEIVFSPLGKRSGAHFNPAFTLTFWRLGKVKGWDTLFYIVAQFLGGIGGVVAVSLFARSALAHPAVKFVATLPGPHGSGIAFATEMVIAFLLMTVVLNVSNIPHLARFTGVFPGCLVATYITFETPISGMSMNPARTFGSAYFGHLWTALWVYSRRR
jgi:aquaporin Z